MAVLAHLSDPHVGIDEEARRRFAATLAALPRVDALVVSGDITDRGVPHDYRVFGSLLPPGLPTVVTPGNHDVREAFTAKLGPRNTIVDVNGVRLVGLDSAIPGRDEGLLDAETLTFAADAIGSASGPVLLAMHHPPIPIGHPIMDGMRLTNPEELADLVASGPVIGLLSGHVHCSISSAFAGVPVRSAPGIVSTLRVEQTDMLVTDRQAPPGFAIHTIADGVVTTRFHVVS